MSYSFRFRIRLPKRIAIGINSNKWDIQPGNTYIQTREENITIDKSDNLVIRGKGNSSPEEAYSAGKRLQNVLKLSSSYLKLGLDFGNRIAAKTVLTEYGLTSLEASYGGRILNDNQELTIFASDPPTMFVHGEVGLLWTKPPDKFREALDHFLPLDLELTIKESLAYDFFSSSFFQQSEDSRFVLLVMAIETLIEQGPRAESTQKYVTQLIEQTQLSALSQAEKDSIIKTLKSLNVESIGQAGKKLVKQRLGKRKYNGMSPQKFFKQCYELRSKLVHGAIDDNDTEQIRILVAPLELFVGDLIYNPVLLKIPDPS